MLCPVILFNTYAYHRRNIISIHLSDSSELFEPVVIQKAPLY